MYVEIVSDPAYMEKTKTEIAGELGVTLQTLWRWDKKVDWGVALERRRKRYALITHQIDDALVKRAGKGDVRAIEIFYQRFDGWVPRSATEQLHSVDEKDVDDELKRLMERKGSLTATLKESNGGSSDVDGHGRAQVKGTGSPQTVPAAA